MYLLQIEIKKIIRNKSQPITGVNEIEGSQFPCVSSVYLESGVEKKNKTQPVCEWPELRLTLQTRCVVTKNTWRLRLLYELYFLRIAFHIICTIILFCYSIWKSKFLNRKMSPKYNLIFVFLKPVCLVYLLTTYS